MLKRVVISYSREDKAWMEEVRNALKPYEGRSLINVYVDTSTDPGDHWNDRIRREFEEAHAVVCLPSLYFDASDYIWQTELPFVFQRADAGECLLTYLTLSSSANLPLEVDVGNGAIKTFRVYDFQGLQDPKDELEGADKSTRHRLLVEAARKLIVRLGLNPDARPVDASRRHPLLVSIWKDGDQLRRSYRSGEGRVLGTKIPFDDRWNEPHPGAPADREALYESMFELLFQGKEEEALTMTFGASSKTPRYEPVRVQVSSNLPAIADLPWFETCWKRHRLIEDGWTFEVVPWTTSGAPVDHAVVQFARPVDVLVIAPEAGHAADGLRSEPHVQAVESLIKQAHEVSGRTFLARSRDEIVGILEAEAIRLVYYYGSMTMRSGAPHFVLRKGARGKEEVPLVDLFLRKGDRSPQALFCNALQEESIRFGDTIGPCLNVIPFVALHDVCGSHPDPALASEVAMPWLRAMIAAPGVDPVVALTQCTRHARLIAWARYSAWEASGEGRQPRRGWALTFMDRTLPKAKASDELDRLIRSAELRTVALLAYADGKNHVLHIGDQLHAHLVRRHTRSAVLVRVPVRLPRRTGFTRPEARTEIRKAMNAEAGTLKEAFRRLLPKNPGWRKPVFHVQFEARGGGIGHPLSFKDLETWASLCVEEFPSACPENAKILVSIGLEASLEAHADLEQAMRHLRRTMGTSRFRLETLPTLGRVTAEDMSDFLLSEDFGLPLDRAHELATLIFALTDGTFEECVTWLEKGIDLTWDALLDELRTLVEPDKGTYTLGDGLI